MYFAAHVKEGEVFCRACEERRGMIMQVKNAKIYADPRTVSLLQTNLRKEAPDDLMQEQSNAASMMDYLTQTYKNVNFSFLSFDSNKQIAQYGLTQTGLNNVTISPKLLEKMSTDEEVRKRVEDVLGALDKYQQSAKIEALLCDKELAGMGLVIDEDGRVSKWTAMKEKDKEDYPVWWRDRESTSYYVKKKTPKVSSYSYSHTTNMMRLAGARDVASVKGLISAKYGEMQRVRGQVEDPAEASAIIRKIKSVIQSGNIKIARLHKEENLRLRQKSAERKMKQKLALQLARELKKKQQARMGQERCQTAHLDDVMPRAAVSDERYRQIAEQYVENLSSSAVSAEVGNLVDTSASGGVSVEVMSAPVTSVAAIDCSA